jgi:large conductance mechanosensitive channel
LRERSQEIYEQNIIGYPEEDHSHSPEQIMTTPQGFIQEFTEFLMKYQVIGLAVAVIIGAAASKMVTAMVADIIMPIIAVLTPGGDWKTSVLQVGPIKFMIGDFIGAIIDFVIVAIVIFLIVKFIMKGDTSKKI